MNQPTEINPEAWRLSMSGYSIVTGYSDDRKTIAQMPATSTRDEIGRWTTLALEIVDEHNARIAELEAERDALRESAKAAERLLCDVQARTEVLDDEIDAYFAKYAMLTERAVDAERGKR